MNHVLKFEELEKAYDWLADAIDLVGIENESLFLSKLALMLAHNIPDLAVVEESIQAAKLGLIETASAT